MWGKNNQNVEMNFSEKEISHYERMLTAEREKCRRAIEKQKEKINELTPKSFFNKMSSNKKKLDVEVEILEDLENRLIELNAMNGEDFLLEEKKIKKVYKFSI